MKSTATSASLLSLPEQQKLIDKLELFSIKGKDRHGHTLLRIIGNVFPAELVTVEAVKEYLAEKIFPTLAKSSFSVVYIHTQVDRSHNFPGLLALRSICNAIPDPVRDNLETVYFLHPGLRTRLFLPFLGPLLLGRRLYWKLNCMNRLQLLWGKVRRHEVEIPDFVYEHDEELELHYYRPVMDYGIESDHPQTPTAMESSPLAVYSMRCIA